MAQAEKARTVERVQAESHLRFTGKGDDAPVEIILRRVDGVWKVVEPKDKPKDMTLKAISDGKGGFKIIEGQELTPLPPPVAKPPMAPGAPAKPGASGMPPTAGSPLPALPGAIDPMAPRRNPDARIDDLEKKLNKVMEMLEQMRKDAEGSHKKAESVPSETDRALAARDAAEAAERRAIREKAQAVEREVQRLDEVMRTLREVEAAQKKQPKP
jgi:hypothetical protein